MFDRLRLADDMDDAMVRMMVINKHFDCLNVQLVQSVGLKTADLMVSYLILVQDDDDDDVDVHLIDYNEMNYWQYVYGDDSHFVVDFQTHLMMMLLHLVDLAVVLSMTDVQNLDAMVVLVIQRFDKSVHCWAVHLAVDYLTVYHAS
jgi:hypothetical protein